MIKEQDVKFNYYKKKYKFIVLVFILNFLQQMKNTSLLEPEIWNAIHFILKQLCLRIWQLRQIILLFRIKKKKVDFYLMMGARLLFDCVGKGSERHKRIQKELSNFKINKLV